jgi:hypothetical protein
MWHLRRNSFAVLAAGVSLAIALFAAPLASAHDAEHGGGRVVAPTGKWDGRTAGELLGDVWYRLYSLPVADNPYFGNGDPCFRLGRRGRVVYPANGGLDHVCTVKKGTPVYVNGLFCAWSSAEDPYPPDEATQRALCLALDEEVETSLISIDGGTPVNVRAQRFSVFSPQRRLQLPPENILGIPPQSITLTAHGWMAMIVHLPLGLHAIRSENTFPDGEYSFTKYINVVRR